MSKSLLSLLFGALGCAAVPLEDAPHRSPALRCAPDVVRVELRPSDPLGPFVDALASSDDSALEAVTVRGRWRTRDADGRDAWTLVLDARGAADTVSAAVRRLGEPFVRYAGEDRVPCVPVAIGAAYGVPFAFEGVVSLVGLEWVVETAQSQYVPDNLPGDLREPGLVLEGVAEFADGSSSLDPSPVIRLLEVDRLEDRLRRVIRRGEVLLWLRPGAELQDLVARYADVPYVEFDASGWDPQAVTVRVRPGEEAAWAVRLSRDDVDLVTPALAVPAEGLTRD